MEMSSPLAAMHPPPIPGPWGYRRDLPTSKPLFATQFGCKDFNFRDMSMMGPPKADYFTLGPMRGSSPTSCLAADMSSNLHVDQSPQLATPRRSLFTSNLFHQLDARAEGTTTPPIRWEGVTTPPIPSSSPGYVPDSMDISPLPHKAPFCFQPERSLPSPSPENAQGLEEEMLSPCELPPPPQFPKSQLENQRPGSAADRRKSALLRPSLARTKNHTTNSVSFKSQEQQPLPPFKFGAGIDDFSSSISSISSLSSLSSAPSLDECFAPSPPQEKRPSSNPLQGSSKPKPFAIHARGNGSPLSNIRKPVGPSSRRPTKFRRSLSMYEHPGDVINTKEDKSEYSPSGLQSVMDLDDAPTLKLPHFEPSEPDSLPRINSETLIDVLNGKYDEVYGDKYVIDCRFEYEYEGGHIDGALNFCEKEQLADRLFANVSGTTNTLLILHCEYSAHRAPLMAKFVRHEDRKQNCHRYPQLSYPEVYILDGGYSSFFESHRTRCVPQSYLRMDAKEHERSCERGLNKLRQRSKLNRAQTFAFGQHDTQMEDSPTAIGRSKSGGVLTLGDDSPNVGRIGATRRMASY